MEQFYVSLFVDMCFEIIHFIKTVNKTVLLGQIFLIHVTEI